MPVVTVGEVQQWLEQSKLTVTALDTELEETARTMVFAKLGAVADTSGWTDETTTPKIVRSIVGMFYSAWYYNRAYSEEDGISDYAQWLLSMANDLLTSIMGGDIAIDDAVVGASYGPLFYPDDTEDLTGKGNEIKFRIGYVF